MVVEAKLARSTLLSELSGEKSEMNIR